MTPSEQCGLDGSIANQSEMDFPEFALTKSRMHDLRLEGEHERGEP